MQAEITDAVEAEDRRYIRTVRSPYPGYRVAIPLLETSGEIITKSFCGYQKPLDFYLAAARAWRDKTYLRHFGVPIPKRIFHKRSNTTYGVPGVRRIVKTVKKALKSGELRVTQVPCVIAEVHLISGVDYQRARCSRSKIYSIKKYGEDEAVRLATRWREAMVMRLAQDIGVDVDWVQPQFNKMVRNAAPKVERNPAIEPSQWIPTPKPRLPAESKSIQVIRAPSFDPNFLLDKLVEMLGLSTDRALATLLEVEPPVLSKIRHRKLSVGATLLLRMHDASALSIRALRDLMGDRRARHYRTANTENVEAGKKRQAFTGART